MKLITTIGLKLSAKILSILNVSEKNQVEYIKNLLIRISKTNHSIANTIVTSMIIQDDQPLYLPKDIKTKIIERLSSLENESSTIYSYNISKILKEMERDNVLQNIKTKKEIKNHGFSKDFKTKRSEEGGYPSIYIRSPTIEEYERILNNSNGIHKINQMIKEYGKLDQFYGLICKVFMQMMINKSEELRKSLELVNNSIGYSADFSSWDIAVSVAKQLSVEETKELCTNFVNNMINNPNSLAFICLMIDS